MNLTKRSSIETKAMSTNQSGYSTNQVSIHNYHTYESILHYITSFMTDIKINIVDLKEIVYEIVDVSVDPYWKFEESRNSCEDCEVEYMMNGFRKLREDVVRITAILKGYMKSCRYERCWRSVDTNSPSFQDTANFGEVRMSNLLNNSFGEENKKILRMVNDVGFLTFREMEDKKDLNLERFVKISHISEENVESSRQVSNNMEVEDGNNEELGIDIDNWECKRNMKDKECLRHESCSNNESKVNRAIELINLIRKETNKENDQLNSNLGILEHNLFPEKDSHQKDRDDHKKWEFLDTPTTNTKCQTQSPTELEGFTEVEPEGQYHNL